MQKKLLMLRAKARVCAHAKKNVGVGSVEKRRFYSPPKHIHFCMALFAR